MNVYGFSIEPRKYLFLHVIHVGAYAHSPSSLNIWLSCGAGFGGGPGLENRHFGEFYTLVMPTLRKIQ